ncbi:MAG TPA: hypothetical protein VNK04_25585 [Gemmataceae bacterium]|nr:hypothetical protein [Gemmataceae bacterium]
MDAKPAAAIDATGLEGHPTAPSFIKRAGTKHSTRSWPKRTVVGLHH